jgi:hypothetical protein
MLDRTDAVDVLWFYSISHEGSCSSKTERREFGMHSPHTHAAQARVDVALSMFLSARPTHGAGKTVRPAWPGNTHSIVHLAVDRRQRGGCLTLPGRLLDDRCRLLCRRLLALRVGCHYGVEVRGSSRSALLKFQGGDTTAAATFGRRRRQVEVAPADSGPRWGLTHAGFRSTS